MALLDFEMGEEYRKTIIGIEKTDKVLENDVCLSHIVSYYR